MDDGSGEELRSNPREREESAADMDRDASNPSRNPPILAAMLGEECAVETKTWPARAKEPEEDGAGGGVHWLLAAPLTWQPTRNKVTFTTLVISSGVLRNQQAVRCCDRPV